MQRTDTSHFFVGRFRTEEDLSAFLEEDYSNEDDEVPISQFCASQGETFLDHDLMESGFRDGEPNLREFFDGFSYAEHWADDIASLAAAQGLNDANTLIFISKCEIAAPHSADGEGFSLAYLGEITYPT